MSNQNQNDNGIIKEKLKKVEELKEIGVEPYGRKYEKLNNISEINASDWAVFKGNLRLLYREFDWFTIDFKDGTGIQVIKNNINTAIYGSLGGEGRVENIEGKIVFNKGYAALINGSGEEADDSALPYGINGIK